MTSKIKKQIEKIKKFFTVYNALKELGEAEDAQENLKENIVEEARYLAKLFTEEELGKGEDADTFCADLAIFNQAAETVELTCYKVDYALAAKHRAVMAAIDEMIFAIAEQICDED